MPGPASGTSVAIFNSHAEFIDGLREALELEGLTSVTALLAARGENHCGQQVIA